MKFDPRGVPIVPLAQKIKHLQGCIEEGAVEDSLGHLFDLINHVAPGYRFLTMHNITELCAHYGDKPTPIEEEDAKN